LPEPVAGRGDVVVAIDAASVNPLDVKQREGAFKLVLPYATPMVLRQDLAGTVIAVGPATRRFGVGDDVFGRAGTKHIGSFAERTCPSEQPVSGELSVPPSDCCGSRADARRPGADGQRCDATGMWCSAVGCIVPVAGA
jgi:NADPH:quinone reductase-like Zn-dependent oxidoreductase